MMLIRLKIPVQDDPVVSEIVSSNPSVSKAQCDRSPFFYAFYNHHPCHVVIYTGATSSVISRTFFKAAGITSHSVLHSAQSADKSQLDVKDEVHITLNFAGMDLPITALVLDKLDCDVLAGIPFCKINYIEVHLKDEYITIKGLRFPYGAKGVGRQHDIKRTESFIVRNDTAKAVMPGEFVEIYADGLKCFEGEVDVEPHVESPF